MIGECYKQQIVDADETVSRIMDEFAKIDVHGTRQLDINQLYQLMHNLGIPL